MISNYMYVFYRYKYMYMYMNLFVKTIFDKLVLSLTEIQGAVLWTKLNDLPMTIWVDIITDLWCL